jgi:hypothetical protein
LLLAGAPKNPPWRFLAETISSWAQVTFLGLEIARAGLKLYAFFAFKRANPTKSYCSEVCAAVGGRVSAHLHRHDCAQDKYGQAVIEHVPMEVGVNDSTQNVYDAFGLIMRLDHF